MKKLIITFAMFVLCQSISIGKQYNVLIIQTDEHHFKTLGCYGGKIVKTPNIDWIAKNGAIATSFYATTPVCSPSRASLITGRYPQNTPVTNNNIPQFLFATLSMPSNSGYHCSTYKLRKK